jgi:ligand-binding sensor domain-containing protein
VYAGAQVLFRSTDRGDHWEEISPDLTTNDPAKTGNNVPFCTITSISESALSLGGLWVGTDDGKVWVYGTPGLQGWQDVTANLVSAGAPADRWVSRVFASPHNPEMAFVSKNGFRFDDFSPYLFMTTDSGHTWKSIASNLPAGAVNVVVQDRKNKNLLFVGTDIGVFVSIDLGASWTRMKANLPTVAVHDLVIHPRENDLVLGTYGRGFWVGDISPLQDLSAQTFTEPVHLFDIEPKARYGFSDQGMNYHLFGDKYVEVPNEYDGMVINYWSREAVATGARVTITDASGRQVAQLQGQVRAGLNHVQWNLAETPAAAAPPTGRGGRGGGRAGGPLVAPGDYRVTLEAAGQTLTKTGHVRERIW